MFTASLFIIDKIGNSPNVHVCPWTGRQIMVYLYNGVPLSNRTNYWDMQQHGGTTNASCLSVRSWTHIATLMYDSIYLTSVQRQIIGTEFRLVVASCWGGGRRLTPSRREGAFRPDGNVLPLDCYVAVYICQTHQNIHLKWWILLYVTYIHKPDFLKSHMWEEAGPFCPPDKAFWSCSSILTP